MTKKEIEDEKTALEATNKELEKVIADAQHTIYWNKKRIKLAESQLAEMPDEETPGEAIQDISKGLDK